jgi:hypothetical protein
MDQQQQSAQLEKNLDTVIALARQVIVLAKQQRNPPKPSAQREYNQVRRGLLANIRVQCGINSEKPNLCPVF